MRVVARKNIIVKFLLFTWMAIFVWINGNVQSLWIDELSSIGYIRSGISLAEMINTYLFCDTNMPLYSIILYYVYRIVPYGEKFLLIPSIIFCVIGINVLSHLMKKIAGERAELITIILGTASNAIIWQGAWEVRCYSLTFMMSVIVFLCYVETIRTSDRKMFLYFTISAFFFMTTHWFAVVLLAGYGVIDLVLILYKKKSWKSILTYIPGLMFFVPWFVISFLSKQEEYSSFWGMIPEWKNMFWTILFWLSGRRVLWYVCLVTGAVVCLEFLIRTIRKKKVSLENGIAVVCTVAIGWVIGIMYIYSRYFNPEGSLYIDRYFIVIAPHIILLTVFGLNNIIDLMDRISSNTKIMKQRVKKTLYWSGRILVGIMVGICWFCCYREEYIAIRKPFEQFREASNYLIEDKRIWDKDTLFVASNKYCGLDGFIEYYFIKRGYEEPANIIDGGVHSQAETRFYSNYLEYTEEELLVYDTIIGLRIHMRYDEKFNEFMENNYIKVQDSNENGIEVWERKTD